MKHRVSHSKSGILVRSLKIDIESILGIHMQLIIQASNQFCLKSVAQETIILLGKSHVLEILYTLSKRIIPIRFNELKRSIDITSTTLSRRLEELVDVGFLNREVPLQKFH